MSPLESQGAPQSTGLAPSQLLPLRRLEQLGCLLVRGADARSYLQGQLSFDLNQLTPERVELAACSSPQGRVQAVLWMVERSDGIALILPTAILEATLLRLRKFVLRAKVTIGADREYFGLYDATGTSLATAAGLGAAPRSHLEIAATDTASPSGAAISLIRWPDTTPRVLLLGPANLEPGTTESNAAAEQAWHLADIQAGLPQVYPLTQEAFVAQMLNVDLLGGVSFEKGCYTGQEIVARTHFRGTVKRRMFRFSANCAAPASATRVIAGGAHAGDVVDAIATANGCELLAVVSLGQLGTALELADIPESQLTPQPLPYDVA